MGNNLIEQEQTSSAVTQVTPMHMLQVALEKGSSLEQMQQLMDLQERWEANEARKAYVSAMSKFKADPPVITKNKHVYYKTQKGVTEYDHASLDHISSAISKSMGSHGLSFRWDLSQENIISVTCIITHSLGHEERVTLSASDDNSGGKNSIQAIGSTVSYLQRYTLLAATGLASMDKSDDDGRGSVEYVSEEQIRNLIVALDESEFESSRWLKHFKLGSISEIQADSYESALSSLVRAKKVSDDNS